MIGHNNFMFLFCFQ